DDVAADSTVEHDRQVQLASYVDALLDIEGVDLLAFRSRLDGHQRRAEHLLCQSPDTLLGGRDAARAAGRDDVDTCQLGVLDEAALAAATCMYLRLDDDDGVAAALDQGTDRR